MHLEVVIADASGHNTLRELFNTILHDIDEFPGFHSGGREVYQMKDLDGFICMDVNLYGCHIFTHYVLFLGQRYCIILI